MGHHTFDPEMADRLEDSVRRYKYLSMEEVVSGVDASEGEVVADIGSGTGFYADDVAQYVEKLYAVDVQQEMHDRYRDKGVPKNVELVTASADNLSFDDDSLDAAYSTMTYHEFATPESLAEISRVLCVESRLYVADWSSQGTGVHGPPTDERYSAAEAEEALCEAGFEVERVEERTETFVVVARN